MLSCALHISRCYLAEKQKVKSLTEQEKKVYSHINQAQKKLICIWALVVFLWLNDEMMRILSLAYNKRISANVTHKIDMLIDA